MLLLLLGCTIALDPESKFLYDSTPIDGSPQVTIFSPLDGFQFEPTDVVSICALMNDDVTPVEELSINLISSLTGVLSFTRVEAECEGGNLGLEVSLSAGEHTLSLSAVDEALLVGEDSVTISAIPNTAPSCTFTEPLSGAVYNETDTINVIASVFDAESEASLLNIELSSSLDGLLWEGTPDTDGEINTVLGLSIGTHTLSLTVTDPLGLSALCTVPITVEEVSDSDGDGFSVSDGDCDDADVTIFPGAGDTWYDGVDSDCAENSDFDADSDGYDATAWGGSDCDDTNGGINPGVTETWYDGVDADCSGASDYDQDLDGYAATAWGSDCDDTNSSVNTGAVDNWYDGVDTNCDGAPDYDQDGDGYDSLSYGGTDCDDTSDSIHPGVTEVWYDGVDSDCAGDDDDDQDGDGYLAEAAGGTDCDDLEASVHPGAEDTATDGRDSDCDGYSPYDADGDTYDDAADGGADCNDADISINPGEEEIWYDGIDQDCDGASDNDQDLDGADVTDDPVWTDCNDTDASIYPGATEVWYDGIDQDCAGDNDNDQDGDGVEVSADCDDTDASISPDATEVWYDGIDADCAADSDYDADADGYDAEAWGGEDCDDTNSSVTPYIYDTPDDGLDNNCDGADGNDADGDGYDTDTYGGTDCDDTDASIYPGATEIAYDGHDNDCDTSTLDDDLDGDGYVAADDCLDTDATINPGQSEVCDDGVDTDCDGSDCLPSSGALSSANAQYTGEASSDYAGMSVSGAGDVNNDGYDDILVGADENDDGESDAGAVYLILGSASPASMSLSAANAQYTGVASEDAAGVSISGAGDVNNDGYDDILVGAYQNDDGGSAAGAAYLLLGSASPTSISLSAADAQYTGEASSNYAGYSVSVAGDVNNDGYSDILVGANGNDDGGSSAGAAYLILGSASPTSVGLSSANAQYAGAASYDSAGVSVSGAGDVNNDGYDDLFVGASLNDDGGSSAGAAYLILGSAAPASTDLSTADAQYTGEASGDGAGISVSGAGDVNNDGYDDLLVGASQNDDGSSSAGAAYLILGSATPASISLSVANAQYTGETSYDYAGVSVSGVGDVNNDGHDDLLVGADSKNNDAINDGAAYLILGSVAPTSLSLAVADVLYTGEASNDYAGAAVSGAGDVNNDGEDDLLIGAYGNDDGGSSAGAAYLILGTGW